MQAAGLELYAQTLSDRGLAAAARAGDQYDAYGIFLAPATAVDLLGDLHELLLLQGLCHLDKLAGIAAQAGVIDVTDSIEVHVSVPAAAFLEHAEGLGLLDVWSESLGMMPVGHAEQDAALKGLQGPHAEISGRRDEAPVVIINGIPQQIIIHVHLAAGLDELDLVIHAAVLE